MSSAADNYSPPPPNYLPLMQAMVEGLQDRARRLERENGELREENARLRKQVEELKAQLRGQLKTLDIFIKWNMSSVLS